MSPKTQGFLLRKNFAQKARILSKTQEFPLKRKDFDGRKNFEQNARISTAQEFRAKRNDFEERKNFEQNARNFGETQDARKQEIQRLHTL